MITPPVCTWPKAPAHPVLSGGEVHVWCASLDKPGEDYTSLLSTEERARAQKFRFELDRQRFMVGRGLLRGILGRYLGIPAEILKFNYGEYGKPTLDLEQHEQTLNFNLSHSGGLALYAVTKTFEVGIDLELIHPIQYMQQVAERFFSSLEKAELAALPPDQKLEAFFAGWTRKEAYLKARGDGLVYPLDQISVSLSPENPAGLLITRDGPQELSRWSLQSLTPANGYAAALAVKSLTWRLEQWQVGS
jgi:4'-phosphopantetheinyl transferase